MYNTVGRSMGYVLAPLASSGLLVAPVCLLFFEQERNRLGLLFAFIVVGAFLCNVYLAARKARLDSGISYFPAVVLIAGISALLLLGYRVLPAWQLYAGCALLAGLDLLGQPFIGITLGKHRNDGA